MRYQKWLLLMALMGIGITLSAQNRQSLVNEKKKAFNEINASPSLRKITLENEDFLQHMTDGGGELVGYYNKNELVKIKEWIGLSKGNRTRMYYFRNNDLIMVVEKFNSFVPKGEVLDKSKTKTTFEGSYYFHNNKLINQEVKGKRNFDDTRDVGSSMFRDAGDNVRILTEKKKSLR